MSEHHPKAEAAVAAALVVGVVAAARHEKRHTGKTHTSLRAAGISLVLGIAFLVIAAMMPMERSWNGGDHMSGIGKFFVVGGLLSFVSVFICVFWFICHWLTWQGESRRIRSNVY